MKHLLLATGCIAMLTACGGGSGSIGAGSSGSADSVGSGGSAKSSGGSSSFGSKRTEEQQPADVTPADTRAFVTLLKSARSDKNNSGTIIRVIGEMDRIGYYNLDLVLADDPTSDTITYQARAAAPAIGRAPITPRSRIVALGAFIPTSYRPNVRTIVIQGLQNTLHIKR